MQDVSKLSALHSPSRPNPVKREALVPPEDEEERQKRRKIRRKIRKIAKKAGGAPSFLQLLTTDYDNSDIEDDPRPNVVVVKKEDINMAQRVPSRIKINVDAHLGLSDEAPIVILDDEEVPVSANQSSVKEEGWYEGTVPMSMPEDAEFLSPLHQWIRSNLEYFSATDVDVRIASAGRRPVNAGRVGVRCRLCRPKQVVGAVSYPANIAGLTALCSQKPALHWQEHCPDMTEENRITLQDCLNQPARRRGRAKGTIPTHTYYLIACQRLGIVDVPGNGLRFGRDLSLSPLPLDSVRHQVLEKQQLKEESAAVPPLPVDLVRLTADQDSERVLAEAVAEADDTKIMGKSSDKQNLTDYMFLTLRQMALCQALPFDLQSRGKKTKMMRVGLAGYCCRHCPPVYMPNAGCRSFASAASNLVSSISHSFAAHLQKCSHVPAKIRRALQAYKRIHQRQMAQLPYGSQRVVMMDLWDRLRQADKSEEEMKKIIEELPDPPQAQVPSAVLPTSSGRSMATFEAPEARPDTFPSSSDPVVIEVLEKSLEGEWDQDVVVPFDRSMISDFVFLTLRQLRAVLPGQFDRKHRNAGLTCIHCFDYPQHIHSASGRSFPSAPDNFASALNTGFYNHMQRCEYINDDLKHALATVRKLHSSQISALQFGAQRRFFNILFTRLSKYRSGTSVPIEQPPPASLPEYSEFGFGDFSAQNDVLVQCLNCRQLPVCFQAAGSIWVHKSPSESAMRAHQEECTGQTVNLCRPIAILKSIREEDLGAASPLVQHDTFKKLISICLGENLSLVDSVLTALATEASATSMGISWGNFPKQVDQEEIKMALVDVIGCCKETTKVEKKLLQFVQTISPGVTLTESDLVSSSVDDAVGHVNEGTASAVETNGDGSVEDPMVIDD